MCVLHVCNLCTNVGLSVCVYLSVCWVVCVCVVPREGTLQAETSVDPEISIDHKTYRHTEIGWLINREILLEGRPLDEHTIDRHEK